MSPINTSPFCQNTLGSLTGLNVLQERGQLDQGIPDHFKNTKTIDNQVLIEYRVRNGCYWPLKKSIKQSLEFISCLKEKNPHLPKIDSINIDLALKLDEKFLNKIDSSFKDLITIDLSHVSFSKNTTLTFFNFSSLKSLRLFLVRFSHIADDFLPYSLEKFEVFLYENLIEGLNLKSAINLKELSLNCPSLKTLPENPGRKVQKLCLINCEGLENCDLTAYSQLTALKIHDAPTTEGKLLKTIPNKLKKLALSGKVRKMEQFDCVHIEELFVNHREELTTIAKIIGSHLKHLNLSNCKSLLELPDLKECPNLEELNMSYTNIQALPRNLGGTLKKLRFTGCNNMKVSRVREQFDCRNVEELYFDQCDKVVRLSRIIGKELRKLSFSYSRNFTAIPDLSTCPNLEELDMTYTNIQRLPKNLGSTLTTLNLNGCVHMNASKDSSELIRLLLDPDMHLSDLKIGYSSDFIRSFESKLKI